jgi:hypothetical protein
MSHTTDATGSRCTRYPRGLIRRAGRSTVMEMADHRRSLRLVRIPSQEFATSIILEDSGELLTVGAKERTGQALSRFLHVVDGLIGQGLRILILATSNEALGKLHHAVSRPGRCVNKISVSTLHHYGGQRVAGTAWGHAVHRRVLTHLGRVICAVAR